MLPALALVLAVANPAAASPRDPARLATAASAPAPDGVVVLGTAGLRWDDLDPIATPALWSFAANGAVGSLVTRSVPEVSCPVDGWLALSAGQRAAAPRTADECLAPADADEDGTVPGWDAFRTARDDAGYDAPLGLLGELLADHRLAATAIGPGAAIALADRDGVVDRFHTAPSDPAALAAEVADMLDRSALVVVDLGTVTAAPGATGADRAEQVADLEERFAAVRGTLDDDAAVMLVSLADAAPRPHLQVLVLDGFPVAGGQPAREAASLQLRSTSTRQDGLVLATDLLATLLEALDVEPAAGTTTGAPVRGIPASSGAERIPGLVDLDRHASAIRDVGPSFFALLVVANVALLATWWLTAGAGGRPSGRTLRRLRRASVVVAALPVATLWANLVPWWRGPAPGVTLLVATLVAAGLLTGLALMVPRWRRGARLGPLVTVAAATGLTIALDVVTGSRLQLGAVLGAHPLLAGRFYGINNSGFALLLVASLLVAAVAGTRLAGAGRRWAGVAAVATIGVAVTVVDGMPGLGSDFGGPPALVPAFAVLALLVAGVRVGWRRLVGVLAAGGVVVAGFAVLDWLRPEAARTHLGRFVQTVLDGGLGEVVGRKLAQNLEILAVTGRVLLGIVAIGVVVWFAARRRRGHRPAREALAPFVAWWHEEPALRHAPPAVALGLVIGLLVNDSGTAIPAVGLALAVPLVLASFASWLLGRGPEAPSPDRVQGGVPDGVPADGAVVRDEAADDR